MHTISSSDKVLVSGANGFVAMWVVHKLLDKGYAVRGAVRSPHKGRYLEDYFKAYGNKFEIAIVEDITKVVIRICGVDQRLISHFLYQDGAFDEAVKGVHAIVHTASPFYLDAPSVNELLGPAVNGTVGILKSALKYGLVQSPRSSFPDWPLFRQGIKRVIVTSSAAAVSDFSVYKVLNEDDWNEPSIREIETKGAGAPGYVKYYASKTAAERAAWIFYKENKTMISWDLTVLNPPYVFGPPIHELGSVEALNTSSRLWYDAVVVGGQPEDFLKTGLAFIDVRDLANAHTLALEKEAAGDERIIVSGGPFIWQQWRRYPSVKPYFIIANQLCTAVDVATSFSPSPILSHPKLPVGYPGLADTVKPLAEFDTRKAARILGLTYLNQEQVTRDCLADFEKRGW
ncbi:hypothetical protein C0995_000787 [Termitomyces sp. Mi166|nr:hypothetical protein C0995_000787 [Termitomyces sp. Mi166\